MSSSSPSVCEGSCSLSDYIPPVSSSQRSVLSTPWSARGKKKTFFHFSKTITFSCPDSSFSIFLNIPHGYHIKLRQIYSRIIFCKSKVLKQFIKFLFHVSLCNYSKISARIFSYHKFIQRQTFMQLNWDLFYCVHHL